MALNRGTGPVPALGCDDCGYSIVPRANFLKLAHCPRCLAKRRIAVPLRENAESVPRNGFRRSHPTRDGGGL